MSSQVPEVVHAQAMFELFWAQLTWGKLERRIKEALKYPDRAVPLETLCPAVMDLAKQVMEGLIGSAIQRPGAAVSLQEAFTFDQRVAILRILEAIIAEYEDWKKDFHLKSRDAFMLGTNFPSLQQERK